VQSSAGCAAREFALHCGEDAFDQGAISILFGREVLAHLQAHSGCPASGATFGRDDASSLELLATECVVAFLDSEMGETMNLDRRFLFSDTSDSRIPNSENPDLGSQELQNARPLLGWPKLRKKTSASTQMFFCAFGTRRKGWRGSRAALFEQSPPVG
jgi:hypothetical protein